ncbi:hypothetical protein ABNF42_21110, partial [Paenibacillus larvae]
RAMNMAPFIFWNLAFYTIIRTQLAMSTFMVMGMAFFMSFFGLAVKYLHDGINSSSLMLDYWSTFSKNFIAAYPLQIIVMGPLVRHLFNKYVLKDKNVGPA